MNPPTQPRYSCVLVPIEGELRQHLLQLGRSVPPELLTEKGIEDDAHITALFGLHSDDPAPVQKLLSRMKRPIRFRLGKVSVFENPEHDVLKVAVDSPDLVALNALLRVTQPHTLTHPKFQPHATIGYLRPGTGKRVAEAMGEVGRSGTAGRVIFSDPDRNHTPIDLTTGKEFYTNMERAIRYETVNHPFHPDLVDEQGWLRHPDAAVKGWNGHGLYSMRPQYSGPETDYPGWAWMVEGWQHKKGPTDEDIAQHIGVSTAHPDFQKHKEDARQAGNRDGHTVNPTLLWHMTDGQIGDQPESPDWRPEGTMPEDFYAMQISDRPVRYEEETDVEVAPELKGFKLEHILRHLMTDPTFTTDGRLMAGHVLKNGDTSALWGLNDELQDTQHPVAEKYNWLGALHDLALDRAIGHSLDALTGPSPTGPRTEFRTTGLNMLGNAVESWGTPFAVNCHHKAREAIGILKEQGHSNEALLKSIDRHRQRANRNVQLRRGTLTEAQVEQEALDPKPGDPETYPPHKLRTLLRALKYAQKRTYSDLVTHAAAAMDAPLDSVVVSSFADHLMEQHSDHPAVQAFVNWVNGGSFPDALRHIRKTPHALYGPTGPTITVRPTDYSIYPNVKGDPTPEQLAVNWYTKLRGNDHWTQVRHSPTPRMNAPDTIPTSRRKVSTLEVAQHLYDAGGPANLIHAVIGLRHFAPQREQERELGERPDKVEFRVGSGRIRYATPDMGDYDPLPSPSDQTVPIPRTQTPKQRLMAAIASMKAKRSRKSIYDGGYNPLPEPLPKPAVPTTPPEPGYDTALRKPKPASEMYRQVEVPEKYRSSPALSDFIQAVRQVRSSGQQVRRQIAEAQYRRLKLKLESLRDAISDAPTTASAGTVQSVAHDGDLDKVRVGAALYGLQTNAPSLLLFHEDPAGSAFLHKFGVTGSAEKLRQRLDQIGLPNRTLLPTETGWDACFYDPDGTLHSLVQQAAQAEGAQLETSRGHGEVLGGGDEAEGEKSSRRSYRSVVQSYERQIRQPAMGVA